MIDCQGRKYVPKKILQTRKARQRWLVKVAALT